ncbi:BTAD domain-containing putative transcriptional regulator [Streptomyces sp.]|uniref:AfsR/SARP family transcriptional regulator n=1 Tax=Streptomyces sp. TaxID=1931 RepID=UPI002811D55D|nr:BTAD domain-containing putative transcriptional regulator [Streptomyces sp.]
MAQDPVEIGVLGALEVRRAGTPAALPGARPRAALAALTVHAPHPVSVDALVAAVWGDDAVPARPRGAVHTVVSRLRAVLGREAVQAGPAGYCLALPDGAVDASRFEALRRRAAGWPPDQAAGTLDEALALWRGPAYAEFADRGFAVAEAARLEELRLRTVEDRAVLALQAGAVDDAVSALEELVAEQPLRERAHGLLMTALYRAGRAAEALDRFSALRRTLTGELGLDPAPALRELQLRILGHDLPEGPSSSPARPAPPVRPVPSATPVPPAWRTAADAFVGREDDVEQLLRAVAAHRLVCLTGPGGIGKSRLVAEVLPELSRRLARPAVVVELDDAAPAQVDARVAAALGLGAAGELRTAVLEYLAASSLVLVLDGCERVLGEVRDLAEAVGRAAPRVHVLATSRHRLELPAEQVLPLAPLPLPDPADAPDRAALTASVRLFLDRLRRVRPSARLPAPVLHDIGELCRRLDGLPLALELAAVQAAALGVRPVLEGIGLGLQLDDEAHGPLRAVVARSYALLDPPDRALLGRLSAFTGTFDLDAAEQVAPEPGEARAGLARLVQASLVLSVEDGAATQYRLLGIIRAFAAERADDGTAAAFWAWAAGHAERCAREAAGPACGAALRGLELARGDLASAVAGALATGRLEPAARTVGALGLCVHWVPGPVLSELALRVGEHPGLDGTAAAALALGAAALAADERGEPARARRLGARALRAASAPAERYLALATRGIAAMYAGDRGEAARCWQDVLAIPKLPDAYAVDAHAVLALAHAADGAGPAAEEHAAAARRAAERSGTASRVAFALYASGEVVLAADPEAAADVLREAAQLADGVRAEQVSAVARVALLSALTRTGRAAEALELARTLLELQRRAGHWPQLWTTLRILAELFAAAGRPDAAELVLAAAETAESAPGLAGPDVERYRALRATVREGLGAERAHRIATLARLLPRTEVLDRARHAAEELSARPFPGPAGTS